MQRVSLGKTGIEVSRLGFGTGTAHPSGRCAQTLMDKREFAGLLSFAFERGINFWDTALQYGTHEYIQEALKQIDRSKVVITTKLVTSGKTDTLRDFNISLKELNIDYLDICLIHGVRTEREFRARSGALEAMLGLKREGRVRAVGLSSHGLSALKSVLKTPEIDLVWARINFAGLCMDSGSLGLYDQLASITWLKKTANLILPKQMLSVVRKGPESQKISEIDRKEVGKTLAKIHDQSRGVVGMKVIAEGHLRRETKKALKYVNSLSFIDSFIVGMLNRNEVEDNCRAVGLT
jgi:aryl-alcohol dehydrogenase-like predicted oxidoreductase